jgi:Kef-type K+ transport system membrane component KefB
MTLTPFAEFALLLLLAAGLGALFVRLRQPVLIAYIVIGIALGPAGLGLVKAHDQVALLAQIGVTVLLFIVGLKLDLQHVRHIGPVALATGLGQLGFTIAGGFVLILLLGQDLMTALYVSVALTFSSTIIIVKLLTDKRELDSLHGRIAVGFLIVQDIAVVLAMMAMSALRVPEGQAAPEGWVVALSLVARLALAVVLVAAVMRWVLPRLVMAMARSQELLLVFAMAWGLGLAALGAWAGFSMEAGAFVAGFTLANTPYREAIHARLSGIRDFLLLFFFIHLGAELEMSTLGDALGPALVLSLFVLIGNPLIVMAIMGYMGYRKRTGFMAGLTVAQISEFSIVFVAMGISLGHVDVQALGLTTLVGLVTITLSTYMILYAQPLYERLAPWLDVFERRRPYRELAVDRHGPRDGEAGVLIFGLGRFGSAMLRELRRRGLPATGIDHDPEAVRAFKREGLPVHFGDAENPDYLESLPLASTSWVVSTLPLLESTRMLVHGLRRAGYQGPIAVAARSEQDAAALRALPIQHIYVPYHEAGLHAVDHLAAHLGYPTTPSKASQGEVT